MLDPTFILLSLSIYLSIGLSFYVSLPLSLALSLFLNVSYSLSRNLVTYYPGMLLLITRVTLLTQLQEVSFYFYFALTLFISFSICLTLSLNVLLSLSLPHSADILPRHMLLIILVTLNNFKKLVLLLYCSPSLNFFYVSLSLSLSMSCLTLSPSHVAHYRDLNSLNDIIIIIYPGTD